LGASSEPADGCAEASTFAGERQDGAGRAYYLRARRYDPQTGRFTQPDPLGSAGGGGAGYAYAGNNPQTYGAHAIRARPDPCQGSGRAFLGQSEPSCA
jgi:RHS repeat-associated protein